MTCSNGIVGSLRLTKSAWSRRSAPAKSALYVASRLARNGRDWLHLVGGTRFHGGKDGHQPQLSPALGQEGFDQILFADVPLADELDFDPAFLSQPFRVFPQTIALGPGKKRVVAKIHTLWA